MAETNPSHSSEKTFRAYSKDDGAKYAQYRYGYHPNLFKRIVDFHVSTGGKQDLVVDAGCGPGTATKIIAPFFAHAIGVDPSEGMIDAAVKQGGVSGNGEPIQYKILPAEDLADDPTIPHGSVDLITAATAAHWFDMNKFWSAAAQALRPGGTVAFWSGNFSKIHDTVPNATKMSAQLDEIEDRELGPFMEPGNILVRDLYANMRLPWDITPAVDDFDQATFFRKEWGTPGNDDAETDGQEFFLNGQIEVNLDTMEKGLATASPVARWRAANPDKVGTEQDVIKLMRRTIERCLHEAGIPPGQEVVRGKVTGVLLMIKKKA